LAEYGRTYLKENIMAMSRDLLVKSITASTTQTQAAGTLAHGDINLVTTGNASDAVTLPANLPAGTIIYLVNLSANAGLLFPAVGGAGNGGTVDASTAIAASKTTVVMCTGSNNYRTFVSA
jgi:hypothetical protein